MGISEGQWRLKRRCSLNHRLIIMQNKVQCVLRMGRHCGYLSQFPRDLTALAIGTDNDFSAWFKVPGSQLKEKLIQGFEP